MTGTAALNMLFGAALMAIGVLAAALADRLRGIRLLREVAVSRERASRVQSAPAVIPVVDAADLLRSPAPQSKPGRVARTEPKEPKSNAEGGEDVIAALVATGYKKPIATEATWACSAGERATLEVWMASALRRCLHGRVS